MQATATLILSMIAILMSQPPARALEEIAQKSEGPGPDPAVFTDQAPPEPNSPASPDPKTLPGPEAHGTRLRWPDLPMNIVHDQAAIFTSPFHVNRQNAKWWILLGGATLALIP